MGGTSTDVALVTQGEPRLTSEGQIAGMPIAVPVIDIHTVGAGGGSIASVDVGGALRVGPESAGADPGPACYGVGEAPTVTDANVVLGRLSTLLAGAMRLDADRSRASLARLAADIEAVTKTACSAEDAALGVVRVASANMERALRVVSVERGYDPRRAALLSFGGAGGLHAFELAQSLGMSRVVIPPFPGAFSALGLLLGDVVRDASRTVLGSPEPPETVFDMLEAEVREGLEAEGIESDRIEIERYASLRYVGQSFEIETPWGPNAKETFHREHLQRYGHGDESRPVETVSIRARARGTADPIDIPRHDAVERDAIPKDRVAVRFASGWRDIDRFDREALVAGAVIRGPALVVEYGSTTLVPDGWTVSVDSHGCLIGTT